MSKVAVVKLDGEVEGSFKKALKLIGNIADLNVKDRSVVIKVGVFDPKAGHHTTLDVTRAIVNSFNKAPKIFIAESDNYKGTGTERLQIWKDLYNTRVTPLNLSEDSNTKNVKISDETIGLSHILFKPNVFVSTHVIRKYEKGSVLKNLLGLMPSAKKAQHHKKLGTVLLDVYEAIGGIDLAVMDGTYAYPKIAPSQSHKRVKMNVLLVGRDAVAVEALGASLMGLKPEKVAVIQEAIRRGIGEGDLKKIDVVGESLETIKEEFRKELA
jgi:uncharacterized protein (DUF362 family)